MANGVLSQYATPTTREIDPRETTAGQLESMLSTDSPYLTQARTSAAQAANRRGLLSSSMGVQAGEAAAIGAAAPIAAQTAGAYQQQALTNQAMQEQARGDVFGLAAARGLSEQQYQQQRGLGEQQYGFQTGILGQQEDIAQRAREQAYRQQIGLGEQQYGFQTGILGQQLAAEQTLGEQHFGQQQELMGQQEQIGQRAAEQAYQQQLGLGEQAYGFQTDILGQQLAGQQDILGQQADIQQEASERAYAQQLGLTEQQFQNTQKLEDVRLANQQTLMNLDAENRERFMGMEQAHQLTLQNNASAVNLYGQTMESINNILSNPDISQHQQQAAVNKQLEFLENSLALVMSMESSRDYAIPGMPTYATSSGGTLVAVEGPSQDPEDYQSIGGNAALGEVGNFSIIPQGGIPGMSPNINQDYSPPQSFYDFYNNR